MGSTPRPGGSAPPGSQRHAVAAPPRLGPPLGGDPRCRRPGAVARRTWRAWPSSNAAPPRLRWSPSRAARISRSQARGVVPGAEGVGVKVAIFAGGYGTRISEETGTVPKPLVEIGGMPILWHIMKIYSAHGLNDFVICCGYKGHLIKRYFLDFFHRCNDLTIDLADNTRGGAPRRHRALAGHARRHRARDDDRRAAQARARLSRRGDLLPDLRRRGQRHRHRRADPPYHRAQGKLATVTAVQQPGRFGALDLSPDKTRVTASARRASRTAT